MKRFAIIVTAALLICASLMTVYAASPDSGTSTQKKVMFYQKPDISVELNGVRQVFKDVNGQTVYPLIYNGTTYLPVRAVSALMKEPVEWDSGSKTVYIGKTLTYPVKSAAPIPAGAVKEAEESDLAVLAGLQSALVTGYSKSDVIVMYDFEIQIFKDINGLKVYPLNYNGSTYLPIRAISGLMDASITWIGAEKRICIEVEEEDTDEEDVVQDEDDKDIVDEEPADLVMDLMRGIYDSEEALYYEASAKVSTIKDATTEEKQVIAASASDNYLKAQSLTSEIHAIDTSDYTLDEKTAYDNLLAFAESNEYYLLVLENIAYMAASDQDYSMLADTFLYFAVEAQTKMEETRGSIYAE